MNVFSADVHSLEALLLFLWLSPHSSPYFEIPRTKPLICGLNTVAKIIQGKVLLDIRGCAFRWISRAHPQPPVTPSHMA